MLTGYHQSPVIHSETLTLSSSNALATTSASKACQFRKGARSAGKGGAIERFAVMLRRLSRAPRCHLKSIHRKCEKVTYEVSWV